tara:strand:- start:74 stop:481 length:408 start_codon:yes stop_codon:yes gene_type:complete
MNKIIQIDKIMLKINEFPVINENSILKEALEEMNKYNLGIVCIINNQNKLLGVITDGDIRRKLLKVQKPFSALLVDDALIYSIKKPITVKSDDTLQKCVEIMGRKQIWDLPVINANENLVGLLHLHPAVKELLKN